MKSKKDQSQKDTDPKTGNEPEADDQLNDDQQATLEKIMAEIEGREAPESEPNDAPKAPVPSGDPPDVQETVASANNPDSNAPPDSPTAGADEDPLSDEQQTALEKIMAEIEGREPSVSEPPDTVKTPATESPPDAQDTTASPNALPDGSPDNADEDQLSDEQQAALEKIMAEIEGNGSASGEPSNDTQMAQPDLDASSQSDQSTKALEELSLEDFNAELAKVIDEANEGISLKAVEKDAAPPAPNTAPLPGEPKTNDDEQKRKDQRAAEPNGLQQAVKSKSGNSNQSTEKSSSASSAGNTLPSVAESETSDTSENQPKDTAAQKSESKPTPKRNDDAVPDAPRAARLIEVPSETKNRQPSQKKSPLDNLPKGFLRRALVAAAALSLVVGPSVWLGHRYLNKSTSNGLRTLAVSGPQETASHDPVQPAPQEGSRTSQIDKPVSEAPFPGAHTAKKILADLESMMGHLTEKEDEIEDLKQYYRKGIDQIEDELFEEIEHENLVDYKAAIKNTRVALALETIQRRFSYIQKLDVPLKEIQDNFEELLYLSRKARIFQLMMQQTSGISLHEFEIQVSDALARIQVANEQLTIDDLESTTPATETLWNQVYANFKARSKPKPKHAADPHNQAIWKEICQGSYDRKYEMTELTPDTAACLVRWPGKDLYLNSLTDLPAATAKVLARWPGEWIGLNGLTSLSPETARYLAQWPGKKLSLNGLTELSDEATEALSNWHGEQLEMIGLQRMGQWKNRKVTLYIRAKLREQVFN
jgi:hypothetical protein